MSEKIDLRSPPHDADIEACVLASMMLDEDVCRAVRPVLVPDDFYFPYNRLIYASVCGVTDAGRPADAMTVRAELHRRGDLDEAGGTAHLATVIGTVPTPAHGPHYAEIVRGHASARRLLSHIAKWQAALYAREDPGDVARLMAEQLLAAESRGGRATLVPFRDVVRGALEEIDNGGVPTLLTGLADLDGLTGGIGLGEYLLIGARPSVGKSLVCKDLARRLAAQGVPGVIVSVEEKLTKIGRNSLAAESGIENARLRQGYKLGGISPSEMGRLGEAAAAIENLPLWLTESAYTLADVLSAITTAVQRHGAKFVVVDYLQLVDAEADDGKRTERFVARISVSLKNLFKRLGVAGIVLSQLNRDSEADQRVPRMSDLRHSGQIEQDADQIWLLHRQDYYNRGVQGYVPDQTLDVIVAKQRDSATGIVKLHFDGARQRLGDRPHGAGDSPF